jgi:hypothetical protein
MSAVANCSDETERIYSDRDIEEKISDAFSDKGYRNKSDWNNCLDSENYKISSVVKCSDRQTERK